MMVGGNVIYYIIKLKIEKQIKVNSQDMYTFQLNGVRVYHVVAGYTIILVAY